MRGTKGGRRRAIASCSHRRRHRELDLLHLHARCRRLRHGSTVPKVWVEVCTMEQPLLWLMILGWPVANKECVEVSKGQRCREDGQDAAKQGGELVASQYLHYIHVVIIALSLAYLSPSRAGRRLDARLCCRQQRQQQFPWKAPPRSAGICRVALPSVAFAIGGEPIIVAATRSTQWSSRLSYTVHSELRFLRQRNYLHTSMDVRFPISCLIQPSSCFSGIVLK